MSLSRCCNAPSFLFTTKRNTPSGTKLRYEVDTSGILPITTEVFKMFPDVSSSTFTKCFTPFRPTWEPKLYSILSSKMFVCAPCRTCPIPNHSSRSALWLETAASLRRASAGRRLTLRISCLGRPHVAQEFEVYMV